MTDIVFTARTTGLPPEEEDKIRQRLEQLAEESWRAINCNQVFISSQTKEKLPDSVSASPDVI